MKINMTDKFLKSLMLAAALGLSGCASGGILDAINPFDSNNEIDQGEVAGEEERISILSLDDQLQVGTTITPADITLPASYVNPDWPQVGGNPTHALQHTAASGPLERIWSKNIGKASGRKGRLTAPPVVAGGRIFVMDSDNRITAFDANDGSEIWDYKTTVTLKGKTRRGNRSMIERLRDPLGLANRGGTDKESVGGGIAVADGKVFVSSGLGVVSALDAVSGELIWSIPTRTPMHSAPTISEGRLFAVSDDNELFAMNANTGEILWTYQGIIESARMLTTPSPAVQDNVVIAPFASGEVVALRVQNGGVLWQDALAASGRLTPLATLNDIASGPVIADGYVIATAQSGVMSAFDLRTGQRIWSQPAGSLGFPLIAGDFVYTVTTESQVAALSKLDGSVIWITDLPNFENEKKRKKRISWSGPVLAGDRLFLASSRGQKILINPYDGTVMEEDKIGGPVFVPPIIANETIYVLTDEARLIALR